MRSIVLLAIAGLLLGGSWSMQQQGRSRFAVSVVALLGVLALFAGVLTTMVR